MQGREEKLRQRISTMRDACEKRKRMRIKKTFFFLSGAIYLLAFICGEIRGDIKEYLIWIIEAPILSGVVMVISLLVSLFITTGAMEDEKSIAKLEGELNAIKFSDKKDKEVE